MKYCSKCGNELLDEAVICPKCGCPVADSNAQADQMLEEKRRFRLATGTILSNIAGILRVYP